MERDLLETTAVSLARDLVAKTSPEDLDALETAIAISTLPSGDGEDSVGFGLELAAVLAIDGLVPLIKDALKDLIKRLVAAGATVAEKKILETVSGKIDTEKTIIPPHQTTHKSINLPLQAVRAAVDGMVNAAKRQGLTDEKAEALGYLVYSKMLTADE